MTAQSPTTIDLYRPVGERELFLIAASGFRTYPPRLPEQPIFYPVTTFAYAEQIARDWNARSGKKGYVTRFTLPWSFLKHYERRILGRSAHEEYWIPAEDLASLTLALAGEGTRTRGVDRA
jgi:hypothetical protein